jgi:hypothetical protein
VPQPGQPRRRPALCIRTTPPGPQPHRDSSVSAASRTRNRLGGGPSARRNANRSASAGAAAGSAIHPMNGTSNWCSAPKARLIASTPVALAVRRSGSERGDDGPSGGQIGSNRQERRPRRPAGPAKQPAAEGADTDRVRDQDYRHGHCARRRRMIRCAASKTDASQGFSGLRDLVANWLQDQLPAPGRRVCASSSAAAVAGGPPHLLHTLAGRSAPLCGVVVTTAAEAKTSATVRGAKCWTVPASAGESDARDEGCMRGGDGRQTRRDLSAAAAVRGGTASLRASHEPGVSGSDLRWPSARTSPEDHWR